jgi:hypothetical protein
MLFFQLVVPVVPVLVSLLLHVLLGNKLLMLFKNVQRMC